MARSPWRDGEAPPEEPGRAIADTDPGSARDPVGALLALDLLRGDGQAELLLQRPGEGAAHGVRLPAGGFDDLGDGGALLAPEHRDELRLLGAVAALARSARVRARGRRLLASAP